MTGTVEDSATTLPDNIWTAPTPTTTLLPVATGTRKDCYHYLTGDDWQKDMTGMYLASNCALAAEVFDVTLEDLEVWNPSKSRQHLNIVQAQSSLIKFLGSSRKRIRCRMLLRERLSLLCKMVHWLKEVHRPGSAGLKLAG